MDKAEITRKPSKTGKHGHGKRKSTKEAGKSSQSVDIAKISIKRLKPGKHGHGNERAHKELFLSFEREENHARSDPRSLEE
ncbi:hypothetical protein Tco_1002978, partial [Tanacetum coccineum]